MTAGSPDQPRGGVAPRAGDGHDRPMITDAELEALLDDAENTVHTLREELRARQLRRSGEGGTLAEQHAEIDRLAEHLANAKVHWPTVRAFFNDAIEELRAGERDSLDARDAEPRQEQR